MQYGITAEDLPGEDVTVGRDAGQEPSPAAPDERLLDSKLTPPQLRRGLVTRVGLIGAARSSECQTASEAIAPAPTVMPRKRAPTI